MIRDKRSAYLSALLEWMASDDRFRTDNGRLRLETLLWGGDELKLVVPAWCGFAVLQHLFTAFTGWEYKQWPLTHAAGIVFCHAKTPIQRSMALAEQLANGVKARQKIEARGKDDDLLRSQLHDQYDYMVLESIDFPIEDDLTAHWSGCYQTASPLRRPLAPIADWPRIEAEVASLLDDFPKGQVYAVARAAVASAWSDEKVRTETYLTALQRMHQVTETKRTSVLIERMGRLFGTAADLKIGAKPVPDPWTWIHLAEFWDYLAPRLARHPVETASAGQTGTGGQR